MIMLFSVSVFLSVVTRTNGDETDTKLNSEGSDPFCGLFFIIA
jgi:hypothetical protein